MNSIFDNLESNVKRTIDSGLGEQDPIFIAIQVRNFLGISTFLLRHS